MIRAILTDIEGTTTSISFVFEVLFPYARARMAVFVHWMRRVPPVCTLPGWCEMPCRIGRRPIRKLPISMPSIRGLFED